MPLKVTALLFGEARDLAGAKSAVVDMPKDRCTVPDFLQVLHEVTGAKLSGKVLVAGAGGGVSLAPGYKIMVNKRIMNPREAKDVVLRDADEVGILPPFSGG
jgi:molybdopterin converting factor small subunit